MEITYLNLAGFKYHSEATDLYLSGEDSIILKSAGDELHYYFNVILGIIFGLDELEKQEFRDHEKAHIFTGLIRIGLGDRILVIERDFETDILACMLEYDKSSSVVYHDRDFIENGKERPYLAFLYRFFPFTDKALVSRLSYTRLETTDPSLEDLLSAFYVICSPKMHISYYKSELNEYRHLVNTPVKKESEEIGEQLLYFENQKQKIRSTLKIEKQLEQLNHIRTDWENVISRVEEKRNEVQQLFEILNQKFPLLKDFDGDQLRKDVIVWRELRQQKAEYDKKFNAIQSQIDQIADTLQNELLVYNSVPATFESDMSLFEQTTEKLKANNAQIQALREKADEIAKDSTRHLSRIRIAGAILPPLVGLTAFFIPGHSWTISLIEAMVTLGAIGGLYGYFSTRAKSELWIQNFELSRLRNENQKLEQWVQYMRSKSVLFDDFENKKIHLERHKKYRKYKRKLENLRAEQKVFVESWNQHDGFKKIKYLDNRYTGIIDLNRSDLMEYLDTFSELKKLIAKYTMFNEKLLRKLHRYQKAYKLIQGNMIEYQDGLVSHTDITNDESRTRDLLDGIEHNILRLRHASGKS